MSQPLNIRRQALRRLEALDRAGVAVLPRARGEPPAVELPAETRTAAPGNAVGADIAAGAGDAAGRNVAEENESMPRAKPHAPVAPSTTPLLESAPVGAGSGCVEGDSLDAIRRDVVVCTRCRELAAARTQTVFGVGDPRARLCFLGEAPGADEDRVGEPFVGRAGQLLDRIIEACTLRREEVYILNILKCRPPGNRNPAPDEAANCREFLDRQLALIRPEFICCLGAVAAQNLLGRQESIGRMRGRVFDYQGIQVVCTYHPAYLLRNPSAKRDTWEDMQMLMKLMGIELPRRG